MARTFLALVIAAAFLQHHAGAGPQWTRRPLSDQIDWVKFYVSRYTPHVSAPLAIAVDASGNVHVTGVSFGPNHLPDITTIKYRRTGQLQWVRYLDGPGNSWD